MATFALTVLAGASAVVLATVALGFFATFLLTGVSAAGAALGLVVLLAFAVLLAFLFLPFVACAIALATSFAAACAACAVRSCDRADQTASYFWGSWCFGDHCDFVFRVCFWHVESS